MEKHLAELVVADIQKINDAINAALLTVEPFKNDEDVLPLIKGFSSTVWHVYTEVMRPVIRQYPELDPDK